MTRVCALGGSRGSFSLAEAKPPTRGKSMVGAALLNS